MRFPMVLSFSLVMRCFKAAMKLCGPLVAHALAGLKMQAISTASLTHNGPACAFKVAATTVCSLEIAVSPMCACWCVHEVLVVLYAIDWCHGCQWCPKHSKLLTIVVSPQTCNSNVQLLEQTMLHKHVLPKRCHRAHCMHLAVHLQQLLPLTANTSMCPATAHSCHTLVSTRAWGVWCSVVLQLLVIGTAAGALGIVVSTVLPRNCADLVLTQCMLSTGVGQNSELAKLCACRQQQLPVSNMIGRGSACAKLLVHY